MAIDSELFRTVMSNFAAGVTVVTTRGADEQPYGLTATAFTSVSLLPPLVLVCIDKNTETYPHFAASGVFAVNLLSLHQTDVSQHFARRGGDKFSGVAWHRGVLGVPLLDGTIGHVECRIVGAYEGGDHMIFLGEIESAAADGGEPLLHFRHAYRRVADLG